MLFAIYLIILHSWNAEVEIKNDDLLKNNDQKKNILILDLHLQYFFSENYDKS